MKSKNELLGIGSLLSATFLFSFFGILTRTIGFSIPLFYASTTRNLLGTVILGILILISKKWTKIATKDIKWIILRSLGGIVAFLTSYVAFIYIPMGTAYFVLYGGLVIGGYILGKLLFNEKLTSIKIVSLILATIGLLLIYSVNFEADKFIYVLAALISGFANAVWNTFSKKFSNSYSILQLNFLDYLNFFIFMLITSLILNEKWVMPELNIIWYANLAFALIFLITGQLIIFGFKHLEAQIGSLVMLTEVLFGIILGYLFYKETISVYTLFGGLIIIFAIILPELRIKFKKTYAAKNNRQ